MPRATGLRVKKGTPSSRPLYATALVLALLAVYGIFVKAPLLPEGHHGGELLSTRSGEDCRLVHQAADKCAFVRRNCRDDEAGLIEYLSFYYCSLGSVTPLAFAVLIVWLMLLFTTIGIAASDFFSVNLSTIATVLGLSESLAGVTFLAFGNGSPDVFSTFAAMSSNSGSMALGELVGAAGFITAVVAGSMALVREFKVSKKTFVRDICFFIAAVSFTFAFLSDGTLHLWECLLMIGFYVFYVIFVVGWHAYTQRRKTRRAREAASRDYFSAPAGQRENDELEPYRDDPDDEDTTPGARGLSASVDLGMLERGPRIDVSDVEEEEEDEDVDAECSQQHVAAEVASSMRVNRPMGRRNTTTITPIRPSLVGALEFRSVLTSLQRERNMRMAPIQITRSYSEHRIGTERREGGGPVVHGPDSAVTIQGTGDASAVARNRSHSSGAVPAGLDADLAAMADPSKPKARGHAHSHSAHTIGGMLAPPPHAVTGRIAEEEELDSEVPAASRPGLTLRIPSPPPDGSHQSSPALSPFPLYTDSPMAMTPNPSHPSHSAIHTPQTDRHPTLDIIHPPEAYPRPVRWWPYRFLPAPHVLMGTLFPTLQGWQDKSVWDRAVSVLSVPSVFLLVITLPVVESATTDDDTDASIAATPASGHLGHTAVPVSYEPSGAIEPETEWQRYRRSTRSSFSRSSVSVVTPTSFHFPFPRVTPDGPSAPVLAEAVQRHLEQLSPGHPKPDLDETSTATSEDQGWNRWLLVLQIFTGPIFAVFIVWANMAEDLENPKTVLVRAVLISLVCSLGLFGAVLLTTSPDHRPKYHFAFCFLGFIISVAWISTIAGEVVGVLKALGVIFGISEAILGLTVFAVGNSVGDLVADVTVARLGYPVMAL